MSSRQINTTHMAIKGSEAITFATAVSICEKMAKLYPEESAGCLRCAATIALIAAKTAECEL